MSNSVGNKIREIRQSLGLSMEEFANAIDDKAKSGTVANWETGKNLPNNKRLAKIAQLGDTTVNELLYGKKTEITEVIQLIKDGQYETAIERLEEL